MEKCLAGEYFNGSDNVLSEMTLSAKRILKEFNNVDYGNSAKRYKLLKQLFGRIGENVCVDIDFHCEYGKHILCGNRVIINMNCTFVDNKPIRIGDRVLIASNVQIYTSSHPVLPQERLVPDWRERQTTFFRTYARPIEIENNVWIGGGCILLPGVTIGENSVIGAGSVVTRPIPPNCVAVGNPCRVIRYFDTDRERRQYEV